MRTPPLASLLVQRMMKLPPPITRDLVIERDLRVPMRDGTVLLADRWAPRAGGQGLPVALLRGPYGRGGPVAMQLVRPLAERGFQVLLQSARGSGGSGGEFVPLRNERLDGLDTVEWMCKQPWFGESIVLYGPSYLGFTQWAIADQAPAQVKAMIPAVTETTLGLGFLREEAFSLESAFGWGVLVGMQERSWATARFLLGARRRRRAELTLPLSSADQVALGERSQIVQDFLAHDSQSPHWSGADASEGVEDVEIPASLVAGWFDVFLAGQLRDYARLHAAGRRPRLTVGAWSHSSPGVMSTMLDEALGFGLAHAHGTAPADRTPVRVFVMGAEQWKDLSSWPPPGYAARRLHLRSDGRLTVEPPTTAGTDGYRYDPADPTPAVGGTRMVPGRKAGRVDNTRLEARPDVLTYTSDPTGEPRHAATRIHVADQQVHHGPEHPSAILVPARTDR